MRFVCFKCGAKVFAPDEKVGAVAPCPKCGERLQVPAGLSDAVSLPQALLVADLVKQDKRTSPPLPEPTKRSGFPVWTLGIIIPCVVLFIGVVVFALRQTEPANCNELAQRLVRDGMKIRWTPVKKDYSGSPPKILIVRGEGPTISDAISEDAALLLLSSGSEAVFVVQRETAQEAREGSAGLRHYYGFAYGRFIIFGQTELAKEIERLLNNSK